jgi:hypothetical protein
MLLAVVVGFVTGPEGACCQRPCREGKAKVSRAGGGFRSCGAAVAAAAARQAALIACKNMNAEAELGVLYRHK